MTKRTRVERFSIGILLLASAGLVQCGRKTSNSSALAATKTSGQAVESAVSVQGAVRPTLASARAVDMDNTAGPPGSPTIEGFTASPSVIEAGKPTTLQWTVKDAKHIGVSPYGTPTTSSISITPLTTMRYVLAATNERGTSTARILVTVKQPKAPRVHHVSTTGVDDSADGSEKKPWASLQKATEAAAPGDTILIHGGTYNAGVRIRKPGLTLTSAPGEWAVLKVPTAENAGAVVEIDPDSHETTLRRLELVGGSHYSVFLQTTWEWGDPVRRSGPGHVLIEDCHIHDSGRDAIKITPGTDDVTIRRCTIHHSGRRDPSNAEGIDNVNGDRMLVEDTYFHDIATSAIYFKGGSIGSRIERSLAVDCGNGILLGFDTSPEYFDKAANPGYFECLDCVARNNIVVRADGSGIGLFASLRAEATHNTIVEAGRKTHAALFFGVVLHDWEKGIPCPPNQEPLVANNIFTQAPKTERPIVEIRYTEDNGGLSGLNGNPVLAANRYYRPDGKGVFSDRRPASKFSGELSKWQSHVNSDKESVEENPQLDGSWHLTAASPCRDKAKQGYATEDYDGAARVGAPDIGADEADAGPPLQTPPSPSVIGTGGGAKSGG
ncbi:MAG: nitrous oxide reductase family maturation protein NosD [Myxococcales bacterium]